MVSNNLYKKNNNNDNFFDNVNLRTSTFQHDIIDNINKNNSPILQNDVDNDAYPNQEQLKEFTYILVKNLEARKIENKRLSVK